ncbi:RibD family protein [Sulfitobacter guttiformis]|uniref:Riboflavin-specific deaminase-like protein n=1 Tax=Sulfitobacter guttiformis TaxID=74349 RepID=A0A420DTS2_9RHOB|nr:RibD family protein [Sulfitobacter guttiformis]KIN71096.1 Bifunctional deaminase-reductase-like protein [Sulfitobacter guttiformis KCTC 32187]RKE97578.1 riboflavin-specific deaminase-like protein [Sulfitobacter guttiformis]
MNLVDVTPKVWDRILSARRDQACLCCGDWTVGERQSLALYGAMAQPPRARSVVAQIGQSLDGRIATESGDAQDVSGPDGLAHLHRMRALSDAVVVGVKTALHDDPSLTVRLVEGTSPARVVIDPDGRLPDGMKLLADDGVRRVVIQAVDRPREKGVEVIQLKRCAGGWILPRDIVTGLNAIGLERLLVEGGGITIARFLEADLLTRLHVAIAPLIIGAGPQGLTTSAIASLAQARRPATSSFALGSDVVFDCALTQDRMNPQAWHSRQTSNAR